jgi:hypothetical protein
MSGVTPCHKKFGCPWYILIIPAATFRTEHLAHTLYYSQYIAIISIKTMRV